MGGGAIRAGGKTTGGGFRMSILSLLSLFSRRAELAVADDGWFWRGSGVCATASENGSGEGSVAPIYNETKEGGNKVNMK
jgi:hypothetical protein